MQAHLVQAEIIRRLDADRDFFNRAGAIIAGRTIDGDLRRIRFVGGNKVVLRQANRLTLIDRRHMVSPILLHHDGTLVQIARAARKRDLLAVIQRELAVVQRMIHLHRQLRRGAFDGAQVAAVLLGHLRHPCPFGIAVGHLHLLDRGQIDHPHLVVRGTKRAGRHVILNIFGKPGEDKLVIGRACLRLHRDRFPRLGRAVVARKQPHLLRFQADNVRGDQLIAVAADSDVSRGYVDVVKWNRFGAGPEQRRSITQIARGRQDKPRQHGQAGEAGAGEKIQFVIRRNVGGRHMLRYRKRVGCEQFEKGIAASFLPVIEGDQPLLEFGIGSFRRGGGRGRA